MRVYISCP